MAKVQNSTGKKYIKHRKEEHYDKNKLATGLFFH